jgi:polyvinyl alcohol dehydrogenase (cytochrome)
MLGMFLFLVFAVFLSAQDGSAIYKSRCATCHDNPSGRIPPLSALRSMTSGAIVNTLEHGSMQAQAAGLTAAEREAVAEYISQSTPEQRSTVPNACPSSNANPALAVSEFGWTSWGADAENTRFQKAEQAGLIAGALSKLELKWSFRLGDEKSPRSQPAVAFGRVFVGAGRDLYALDAKSGCSYWVFHADEPVRSAVAVSLHQHAVFFAAHSTEYAVGAATGKLLWKKQIDTHPAAVLTAAPAVHAGVLYVPVSSFEEALAASPKYTCCTFRGSVVALNAANGDQLWKTYTIEQQAADARGPSGAAVWSTPTFDNKRNLLYIATGDNYSNPPSKTSDAVLALDAKTGKIVWSRQLTANDVYNIGCDTGNKKNCEAGKGNDFDFGQPPILVSLANGKRALVIGQKSGVVHALDPDAEGKPLWSRRVAKGGKLGGIQWGSAAANGRVFVAVSDIALSGVHDDSSPSGFRLVLNPEQGGGLFALDAATGQIVWSAKPPSCEGRKLCSPAQSAPVTAIPGAVLSGSVDGHLRAYAADDGAVLWDMDTEREYDPVNGGTLSGAACRAMCCSRTDANNSAASLL